MKSKKELTYVKYQTRWGLMTAAIAENGHLKGLWFDGQKHYPLIENKSILLYDRHKYSHDCVETTAKSLADQIKSYEHDGTYLFDLPMEPDGTPFQRLVWQRLTTITVGTTITYKSLAQQVASSMDRDTMSAQAVGQAVGRNPLSIIIPCHRVLGSQGQLTGYAGGIDKKINLLRHEGVVLNEIATEAEQ